MLYIKLVSMFRGKVIPIVYYLARYRLHYIKCNEESCDYKGLSKRVVSILYIGLLFIATMVAVFTTHEYIYSALGFIAVMSFMTFFGSERCPKCMGESFDVITQEEYAKHEKEYVESVERAREQADKEESNSIE